MKYIVTSGCSFTRQYRRVGITGTAEDFMEDSISQWKWPHFIQAEYLHHKVLNYGNPTNDNAVIAQSILYAVNDLIKKGVPTSDIKVIVQWSGWSRNSAFVSKDKQYEKNYQHYFSIYYQLFSISAERGSATANKKSRSANAGRKLQQYVSVFAGIEKYINRRERIFPGYFKKRSHLFRNGFSRERFYL